MSKAEFIDGLGKSLRGKVDEREYRSQIEYYSSYISSQIAAGRNEEDVVGELGDPRLIAKTIVQTYSMKDNPINRQYRDNNYNNSYGNEEDYQERSSSNRGADRFGHVLRMIILALVVLCIVSIVFRAVVFVAPIIILLIIIWFIIRYFSTLNNK